MDDKHPHFSQQPFRVDSRDLHGGDRRQLRDRRLVIRFESDRRSGQDRREGANPWDNLHSQ